MQLYVTLARFDVAYYTAFNANKYRLKDYPNLWAYARDLYETEGFGDTTNFEAIKMHYYLSAKLAPDQKEKMLSSSQKDHIYRGERRDNREQVSGKKEKFLFH